MLVMTIWAVYLKELDFLRSGSWLLAMINGTTLVLALWMVAESLLAFRHPPADALPVLGGTTRAGGS